MNELIEHTTGKCPVSPDTVVEVHLYNGEMSVRNAGQFRWHNLSRDPSDHIMKYRVVELPKNLALTGEEPDLWNGDLQTLLNPRSHDFNHYLSTEKGMRIRAVLFDAHGRLSDETMKEIRSYMMVKGMGVPAASDATRLFYASEMQRITGMPALHMFS